jgi:plastocyanin
LTGINRGERLLSTNVKQGVFAMRLLWTAAVFAFLAGPVAAGEHKVGMIGMQYAPQQIAAKIGDTLVFNNDDTENHMVFSPSFGHGFDLGSQKPGEMRKLEVKKEGTFDVECVFHPEMVTKVTVSK